MTIQAGILEKPVCTKSIRSSDKLSSTKPAGFKSWVCSLRATKVKGPRLAELMEQVENQAVKLQEIEMGGPIIETIEDDKRSETVHAILVTLFEIDSEPFNILETRGGRGVGCWRLSQRWRELL